MIIVSSISPRAVAALPSELNVQCVRCKVYSCVWMPACVYLCTAFGSLWFPLSLMSFVMFWSSECLLMGVICFLPLPCSPLPLPPPPQILLYLHAVPPVPHLPPQLLSLCAQTLRPALNLQLMVGISTFLLMSLFVSFFVVVAVYLYLQTCLFLLLHNRHYCARLPSLEMSALRCVRFMFCSVLR